MSVKEKLRIGLSLRWQIALLIAVAIVLSLLLMGWLAFRETKQIVQNLTLQMLNAETANAVTDLRNKLRLTRADVVQAKGFPPIDGLIRCWDNDGMDPVQVGSTTEVWIDRFSTILRAQMETHPERQSCALLDSDGKEVLAVERTRNSVRSVAAADLRSRTDAIYYDSMLELRDRDVYVAPIEFNGDASHSVALMHFASPVYDDAGKRRGALVFSLDASVMLGHAASMISSGMTDITDDQDRYLHCEANRKNVNTKNYSEDKPVRAKLLQEDKTSKTYQRVIPGSERPDGQSLIAIYQKLSYAPGDESRFLAIAPSVETEKAFAPIRDFGGQTALFGVVIVVVGCVLTFAASRGLTGSISNLARAADQVAAGDLETKLPNVRVWGEVQTLSQSFQKMTDSLRDIISEANQHEQRTQAILNSTPIGIVTLNEAGEVQNCNKAIETIFGYTQEALVGRNASILVRELSQKGVNGDSQLKAGEVRELGSEFEVVGRRLDGGTVPLEMRVTETLDSDERLFIATMLDITERHEVALERDRIFDGVREAVNLLSTSSSEILASTTQQTAGAQEQAAAVSQTVATVDEVVQTAEQATLRAREVAEQAARADTVGKSGRQAVNDSIGAMENVRDQVESIAQNILELAERAQAISAIITTVNDIADQTNLLALNAAIEASRAGEHGKGFAVVAAEVKLLAEQSKKATEQVREILGEIQDSTNKSVMSTEQGTKAVAEASRVVDVADQTIAQLADTIGHAERASSQIQASAGQQALGMKQISESIGHIDHSTKQALAAMRQTEAAARDLDTLGRKLTALVEQGGQKA